MEDDLIEHSKEALAIIEETIESSSPFYGFVVEEDSHIGLGDCIFPDYIADPLALVREYLGDDLERQLRYEDDLEHIAHVMQECLRRAEKGCAYGSQSSERQEI